MLVLKPAGGAAMRIVFLVNRDIESNYVLNLLLPELHSHTVGIFLSERVGASSGARARMLGQLAFIEQDLFSELVFPFIELSVPGSGRFAGFGELSRRFGIPLQGLSTLKDQAVLRQLYSMQADLFVSIRFGLILDASVLGIPHRGILNLHSGLLPQYRGVLATLRALLNGDDEIGCTLHWIDSPSIDRGDVIARARRPVVRERSLFWHILSLYPLGAELIMSAIRHLGAGESIGGEAQDAAVSAYYSFPVDEDLARFTEQGWRLFDREDIWELLERYGCRQGATPGS